MKAFSGGITITRFTGSSSGISIRIEDEASRTLVIDAEMSIEAFGAAITGFGYQPITFEVNADKVGMKHEHKKELVWIPNRDFSMPQAVHDATIRHALSKFETNGWQGWHKDADNPHNVRKKGSAPRKGGHYYEVTFFRHVTT